MVRAEARKPAAPALAWEVVRLWAAQAQAEPRSEAQARQPDELELVQVRRAWLLPEQELLPQGEPER